jgi:ribosome-associated protein
LWKNTDCLNKFASKYDNVAQLGNIIFSNQLLHLSLFTMKEDYKFSKDLSKEFEFITSRSSGPGGQNVNKVNSKVELRFSVFDSNILTQEEKDIIFKKLYHHISNQGILSVTAQTERSQILNKEIAIQKFYQWIELALKPVKPRRKTRPTRASKEKRLADKQQHAQKKESRRKLDF